MSTYLELPERGPRQRVPSRGGDCIVNIPPAAPTSVAQVHFTPTRRRAVPATPFARFLCFLRVVARFLWFLLRWALVFNWQVFWPLAFLAVEWTLFFVWDALGVPPSFLALSGITLTLLIVVSVAWIWNTGAWFWCRWKNNRLFELERGYNDDRKGSISLIVDCVLLVGLLVWYSVAAVTFGVTKRTRTDQMTFGFIIATLSVFLSSVIFICNELQRRFGP